MEWCKDPRKQTLQWSYDFGGNNSSTSTIGIHPQSFDQIARISGSLVNIGSRAQACWGETANQMRDGMPRNIFGMDSINKGNWWQFLD